VVWCGVGCSLRASVGTRASEISRAIVIERAREIVRVSEIVHVRGIASITGVARARGGGGARTSARTIARARVTARVANALIRIVARGDGCGDATQDREGLFALAAGGTVEGLCHAFGDDVSAQSDDAGECVGLNTLIDCLRIVRRFSEWVGEEMPNESDCEQEGCDEGRHSGVRACMGFLGRIHWRWCSVFGVRFPER
jgi:hypothetical protein